MILKCKKFKDSNAGKIIIVSTFIHQEDDFGRVSKKDNGFFGVYIPKNTYFHEEKWNTIYGIVIYTSFKVVGIHSKVIDDKIKLKFKISKIRESSLEELGVSRGDLSSMRKKYLLNENKK